MTMTHRCLASTPEILILIALEESLGHEGFSGSPEDSVCTNI